MNGEHKSIAIIGAGIAGLATGCYALMNGYRARIFEMHHRPGGLCTSWHIHGYTVDGCLHWLIGSGPATGFHRIWLELGAVQGRRMVDHDEYLRIETNSGQTFTFYTDIGRLERHMKDLAPEDTAAIEEFARAVRVFARYDMPVDKPYEMYGLGDIFRLLTGRLPLLRAFVKWKGITVQEFAGRFKSPLLREAIPLFWDLPDLSMAFVLMNLGWMHMRSAGYPIGGSLKFAEAIERRYHDLGGEISYRSPVASIVVEGNRALGVRLASGAEHHADHVVSAADGHTTIFRMLSGRYLDDRVRARYDSFPTFPPLVQVALGVARSFADAPRLVAGCSFPLPEPVTMAGRRYNRLGLHIHNFDDTLAPPGKTVVKVVFESDYGYWQKLSGDPAGYNREKEHIADAVIGLLDRRFPGLAAQVEVRDVASPLTYERYTGNWKGAYEGWLPTPRAFGTNMKKTLPGLANFYMAGQWVEPGGGVPTAALSGRNVIQLVCRQNGRPFVTSVP